MTKTNEFKHLSKFLADATQGEWSREILAEGDIVRISLLISPNKTPFIGIETAKPGNVVVFAQPISALRELKAILSELEKTLDTWELIEEVEKYNAPAQKGIKVYKVSELSKK